jgi:uncharacterized membrane protein YcaP (DUF421 family)
MLLAESDFLTDLHQAMQSLFGGDEPQAPLQLHQIAARSALIFLMGLAVVRVGKNRMISRVTSFDVLFGFLMGSLLSRGVTGGASLSGTLIACGTIAAVHWLLGAMCFYWHTFGILVKGQETLLVRNHEVIPENLRRTHLSDHDLQEELRLQGVDDLQQVRLAYQERNGEVSVLKVKPSPAVLDIRVEQGVQTVRIQVL